MPRRHIFSAAGALAAALILAAQAPVEAQEATGGPLRGSVGLQNVPDTTIAPAVTGVGQGQATEKLGPSIGPAVTGVGQGQASDQLDTQVAPPVTGLDQGQAADRLDRPIAPAVRGLGQGQTEDGAVEGLGGMGDEALPGPGLPPLGGLGDEPLEEVVVAPEETIGLTRPTRAISEPSRASWRSCADAVADRPTRATTAASIHAETLAFMEPTSGRREAATRQACRSSCPTQGQSRCQRSSAENPRNRAARRRCPHVRLSSRTRAEDTFRAA